MKQLSYALVRAAYPDKVAMSQEKLYRSIGYPDRAVSLHWMNTCAVRVSLALLKAGLLLPGQTMVKAGPLKGRRIEHNVVKLANYLARPSLLGEPEKFPSARKAQVGIQEAGQKGIIAFFKLGGPTDSQNHIDVIGPGPAGYHLCASDCYWGAGNAWFWPLH